MKDSSVKGSSRRELPCIPGYEVLRFLSSGGEGQIYVVRSAGSPEETEMVCKTRACFGILEANEAIQEVMAMTRVSGPHNVGVYDAFLTKQSKEDVFVINLVMEYCAGGDLDSYLFGGAQPRKLDVKEILELALGIADGLCAIHHAGLVHRDIKAENIFLTATHEVKIGDLGLSQSLLSQRMKLGSSGQGSGSIAGVEGTSSFMAPEVFSGQGAHNKADIWSFGCILWEMMHSQSLGRKRQSFGLEAHNNAKAWRAEAHFSQDALSQFGKLADLAVSMLHLDPLSRPSMHDCLSVLQALLQSHGGRVPEALHLKEADLTAGDGRVSFRPLRKGEEREAARVLAKAYAFDPRFYYYTYAVDKETRETITFKLMEALLQGAQSQKAVWAAVMDGKIVGVMIVMSPDDKKRPPISTLVMSGWKLLKHTKLLLPGMKLYGTAMKEVDRVFPNQDREWFIINLGVLPEYQSRGIGKGFVNMVVKWSDEQGTRIDALVFHHRQVAFLERFSFKTVSQVDTDKQPSFFTLAREPVAKGQIQLSARTSIQIDGICATGSRRGSLNRDRTASQSGEYMLPVETSDDGCVDL